MAAQIRQGRISKVNYAKGTVQVLYDGTDDVSDDLNVVCGFTETFCMPAINDEVLVVTLSNNSAEGFVVGKFWNGSGHKPASGQKGHATIKIDGDLTITADKITTVTKISTEVH